MFHGANHWLETGRAGPSQTPQHSYRSDVVFMQKQVCPLEEDQCGSARGTAGTVAQ